MNLILHIKYPYFRSQHSNDMSDSKKQNQLCETFKIALKHNPMPFFRGVNSVKCNGTYS